MAKMRRLINNCRVKALESPVRWGFNSKCPDKWIHIDCEDGYIYVYDSKSLHYKKPSKKLLEAALVVIVNEFGDRFPKTSLKSLSKIGLRTSI
jgi:hypothetical protein